MKRNDPTLVNKKLSKDSVRRKGITKKIRTYFFQHPHSKAKQCCKDLNIPYKKYKQTCWRIKSETKQLLLGKVEGRVLVPLTHRDELRAELPRDVVDSIIFEASKRRPSKDERKPFDEWYVTPNRNRMMLLKNDYATIRVWPKTGTCRVLLSKSIPHEWVRVVVQNALFKAGVDLRVCEQVSETVEPKSRSRIFRIGPVTPFKIDYYKGPLGLTIKADASHPDFIECDEDWPTWIKPFLRAVSRNTEALQSLQESHAELTEKFPARLDVIASSFEKSMEKHLNIIETFRKESEARARNMITKRALSKMMKTFVEAINTIVATQKRNEKMLRKLTRRRKRKPKPKPLTLTQKLRRLFHA